MDEAITLLLGNLLPGQTAIVELQLIRALKITGSSYDFTLPIYYFPQYAQHEVVRDLAPAGWFPDESALPEYTFEYDIELRAKQKISMISAPEDSEKTATDKGYRVTLAPTKRIPKRELRIFYKHDNMMEPQLKY